MNGYNPDLGITASIYDHRATREYGVRSRGK
jgi:hypothetical protein